MARTVRKSIPAGLVQGKCRAIPPSPPPILFEGRGSSVHRLRPKKTVFVTCREEYHTLSVERP